MTTTLLRIALISETFPPEINGVANTLGRLAAGLLRRGHQIQVVRPRQYIDGSRHSDAELVLTRGWPLPGYPGLQWGQSCLHKLLRHWKRLRPDVLYIATEGPLGLAALRAARRLQIPVISGFHTNFQQYSAHYGFGPLMRLVTLYLRWFHNRTLQTLVPSVSQSLELQRRGFEHLAQLSRGVDSQLFHPGRRDDTLRGEWGLGERDIAVLHVGRLAAEKNLLQLGSCFRALCAAHPQLRLRLVIVGDGPQRAQLQREMPEAVFCGLQRGEELARHYACGDLFLFPSLSETFGNVVLEALASGLAVVAFDQAAAGQHIRHGHNGTLATPGDNDGFFEAASWLLEDPERLRRVRLNARHHASHQAWDAVVDRFEGYLHEACRATSAGKTAPSPGQVEGSSLHK
ncbi:glycosyltransferase family 1 protein [Pseudomonas sp. ZM23]|uniref:Glycosyltransferase family 1 protein n=1 Tax=Pseudomonas triclosanedens TaxID=2961893 RepID=A0ABY6ZW53_9PSED|nr:glycosyltransferase family 1 protein [Pseudomonas triclosanedens]MCP8463220.1 glycosyltransferase family 1 protein [Pseudomonas triclosanedens]MCP8469721.1 glycosyltransferase family 1 protein [Pseudomonas triclosanedens]MCP8474021.1 glycosyltransferase family 1 protein [Pseudomonas triclosanedens]WAI48581.1 glycosyltransferase family 1 protein [Pseudomonas triclosanedens]